MIHALFLDLVTCNSKISPLPICSVWVARKPPGFAFVEFEDRRDATDAVRALNGTEILFGYWRFVLTCYFLTCLRTKQYNNGVLLSFVESRYLFYVASLRMKHTGCVSSLAMANLVHFFREKWVESGDFSQFWWRWRRWCPSRWWPWRR